MVQNIPISNTFDEYGGAYLGEYIRVVPSTTSVLIGSYAYSFGEGTLNSGYLAGSGGVSMTSTASPTVPSVLCCTSWRAFSNLTQTAEAVFKLATTAGAATDDSFRQCCVAIRVQGGTFTDTWQHERNENVSCYMLLLVNTGVQGCQFQGVRINNGTVTLLGTVTPGTPGPAVGLPSTALALIGTGRKLKISVIGSGGNPNLSVYTANADGSNEILLGTLVDSSVNKITTAGRCMFGMTTDRSEAGGTKTATLCTYFRAVDDGPPLERLRDEWVRNFRHGQFNLTTFQANLVDGNGVSGKRAQQHWIGDIYGQALFGSGSNRIPFDTGLNRLKMPWSGSPAIQGSVCYLLSTIPPGCGKCVDKTALVTYVNPAPDPARGTTSPANDIRIYLWEVLGIDVPMLWVSYGLFFTAQWDCQALGPGLSYSENDGGVLGLGIGTHTYRWIVSVSGNAPTRLWKFQTLVNGVQIPFTGSPAVGWSLNGDGSFNLVEATGGALPDADSVGWCRILWNGTVGNPSPDGFVDDQRIDTFGDTSPACCDTAPTLTTSGLVLVAPPLDNVLVITPTTSAIQPSSLVLFAPGVSVAVTVQDNTGKDPAGQIKTSGIAKGRISFSGIEAGRLGST